jgi:hypothetical protein
MENGSTPPSHHRISISKLASIPSRGNAWPSKESLRLFLALGIHLTSPLVMPLPRGWPPASPQQLPYPSSQSKPLTPCAACPCSSGSGEMKAIPAELQPFLPPLAVVGGLYLLSFVGTALLSFYRFFLRPGKNLKKLGAWGVVTGATGEALDDEFLMFSDGTSLGAVKLRGDWIVLHERDTS